MDGSAATEMDEDIVEDERSSDEDSDSDDSDFVEISLEDEAAITKLETELGANPNLYDLHLQVLR